MFVLQVSGDNKRDSQAWNWGDGGDLQKAGEQTGPELLLVLRLFALCVVLYIKDYFCPPR